MDGGAIPLGDKVLTFKQENHEKPFCRVWVGAWEEDDFRPFLISERRFLSF
jgi:hypothetical protein